MRINLRADCGPPLDRMLGDVEGPARQGAASRQRKSGHETGLDAAPGHACGVDPHLPKGLIAIAVDKLDIGENPLALNFLHLYGVLAEGAAVEPRV